MRDKRILQNLCWMSEEKLRLQRLAIETVTDDWLILAQTIYAFWVILTLSKSRQIDL